MDVPTLSRMYANHTTSIHSHPHPSPMGSHSQRLEPQTHPYHSETRHARSQQQDVRPVDTREALIEEALQHDVTIVKPAGPGKALLASELITRIGTPALYLTSTDTRCKTDAQNLINASSLAVEYLDQSTLAPPYFDVLVTTPATLNYVNSEYVLDLLQWRRLKCVIFDDVHTIPNNRSYSQVVHDLRHSKYRPKVLAFTEFLADGMCTETYQQAVEAASTLLLVHRIRVALQYSIWKQPQPRIMPSQEISKIQPTNPTGLPVLRSPLAMLSTFLKRVEQGSTAPHNSLLAKCILQMEVFLLQQDSSLPTFLLNGRDVKEWDTRVWIQTAMEKKKGKRIISQYHNLQQWYEALRQLVISWEEDDFIAVSYLRMFHCATESTKKLWPQMVQENIAQFWSMTPVEFQQFAMLRRLLLEKLVGDHSFRGRIKVKKKITAHVLEHFVSNDKELSLHFTPACLYAPSTGAGEAFHLTRDQFRTHLESFEANQVNLLIMTNVSMKGTKTRATDWQIDFEESCGQISRGMTESDVHVESEWRAESHGVNTQRSGSNDSLDITRNDQARLEQKKREEEGCDQSLSGLLSTRNALGRINSFSKHADVLIEVKIDEFAPGHKLVLMTYKSILREITTRACGNSKIQGRRLAAIQLVEKLRAEIKREMNQGLSAAEPRERITGLAM